MAIPPDPRAEVRGACEGKSDHEDVLHESPYPSYVGNNLATYSRRKDSAGHDTENTSRRKTPNPEGHGLLHSVIGVNKNLERK